MPSLSDSPFVEKLNINFVPSEDQVAEIRALLAEPMAELAQLDAQTAELEAALERVRGKRRLLQQDIGGHKALIAPMRRIPQDVLQQIFIACLPDAHNALIHPRSVPLLLCVVCKYWRNVAHSTPELWKSLHIPTLFREQRDAPPGVASAFQSTLEAWLERSRAFPLSVSYVDPPPRTNHPFLPNINQPFLPNLWPNINQPFLPNILPNILRVLQMHSHRIQKLDIVGRSDLFLEIILLAPRQMPMLQSVSMRDHGEPNPASSANLRFWTVNSLTVSQHPNIRRVVCAPSHPLMLGLPFDQLTHLTLASAPPLRGRGEVTGALMTRSALEILGNCSNLVYCCLTIGYTIEAFRPPSATTLRCLEKFIILFSSGHTRALPPVDLLQHLILPKLRYICIDSHHPIQNSPEDHIPPRLAFVGAALALEVSLRAPTQAEFYELLRLFPEATHLRVADPGHGLMYPVNNALLEALTPSSPVDVRVLCPLLKYIRLESASAVSEGALVAFLRARAAAGAPLQDVYVDFQHPVAADVMSELEQFITSGLKLELGYLPAVRWRYDPAFSLPLEAADDLG